MQQMLSIFFPANMADHSFNAKSLLFQSMKSRVDICLFAATDYNMCTFLAQPFSNRQTDAVNI